MNEGPLEHMVTITNPHGFHLRPMAAFVQLAGRFQSRVTLRRDDRSVDGKSMFDLMLLEAVQGSTLTVQTEGPDARDALDALVALLERPPVEEEESAPSPLPRNDGGPPAK